jgi:hypothetical protein
LRPKIDALWRFSRSFSAQDALNGTGSAKMSKAPVLILIRTNALSLCFDAFSSREPGIHFA